MPLRLKNLAASHLVLRGKASQMICDHRNFTLGQLEAGCWPAMSWLLTAETEQLLSGHVLCSSGCQLLRGQKCRTGSDLLCLFQKYVLHGREEAQRQQRTPSCKSGRQDRCRRRTLDDRRMNKPVLLVMRRKGEKMEEKRMWKQWERKIEGGKQKMRGVTEECAYGRMEDNQWQRNRSRRSKIIRSRTTIH